MKKSPNIAGVILAAGESSRMGSVKQLLPFRGKTILQSVIESAEASSLQMVMVVLGFQADLIEPAINSHKVRVVINRDFKDGQSSSLKAALQALPEGTDAVLFMLGDQPLVTTETIERIMNAYLTFENPIVIPVFDGKRGNPVLFSSEMFSRIGKLTGDSGARVLFQEYSGQILEVPVGDDSICFDVDTQDDYRQLLESEN